MSVHISLALDTTPYVDPLKTIHKKPFYLPNSGLTERMIAAERWQILLPERTHARAADTKLYLHPSINSLQLYPFFQHTNALQYYIEHLQA